jgi:undecaprenyl-diphosphatase
MHRYAWDKRNPMACAANMAYSLQQLTQWDHALCIRVNRASGNRVARDTFRAVSWLGNGIFWYALILALLLAFRTDAVPAVAHMIVAGLVCTLLYKWLKHKTSRPRPYQVHHEIVCSTQPLDQFSFPSGHTLHAVAFSIVAIAYYPPLVWLLLPFSLLTASSRVVLGLHYPSDVLAGAFIGTLIAGSVLTLI